MSKRDKIELKELESLPEALDGNHRVIPIVTGEDGKLEQRWVQTGKVVWDSYTQIRGGLTPEDYVAFPYGRDVVSGAKTEEATVDALYSW